VVDAWYLSGYEPLRNPEGEIIGMLYVGLLEAPYNALRTKMIWRFALPTLIVLAVGLVAAVLGVRRIIQPLKRLQDSAGNIAAGNWDSPISPGGTYQEIKELADALHTMQEAIQRRDQDLRSKNTQLGDANDRLTKANNNYMSMLGFVTHELKAPLANIQSLINLLVEGYVCEIPEKGEDTLIRIKRNCEELQDMVKNYLDLSRAERGELEPRRRDFDLVADVVQPCVSQAAELFRSRNITLDVEHPDAVPVRADPELLRIALNNYVNNAAKYGREGGRARLTLSRDNGDAVVEMWNEGAGFTPEEGEQLFKKFSRLENQNTKSKKGSGLGLFLCSQVLDQHGGRVWAESEPGKWARFGFQLPTEPTLPGKSSEQP
jgi:signal transduction histidine kinase